MKRFTGLTIALLLCILSTSFGQTEEDKNYISKGQWLVGGKLSLSTGEDFENYTFSVSPMGGYFIGGKIAVGLSVNYAHSNIFSVDAEPMGSGTSLAAAPFVRYYFSVNKLAPFAEVTYGGNWQKWESSFNGAVSKNPSSFYSGGIGLNYFISRNVALEGVMKYEKTINSDFEGTLGFDIGIQFFPSRKNTKSATDEKNYISKGQWLIGGIGDVSLNTIDDIDLYGLSISPMGGYLIGQKIAVGLSTGYMYRKGTTSSFFAQPFLRYYLSQKRLAPFAEVAYGAAWSRIEYFSNNEPVVIKITGSFYRIGAGLNYFISKNVALEGNLRYSRNNDFDSGSINFSAGLQFFIR